MQCRSKHKHERIKDRSVEIWKKITRMILGNVHQCSKIRNPLEMTKYPTFGSIIYHQSIKCARDIGIDGRPQSLSRSPQ